MFRDSLIAVLLPIILLTSVGGSKRSPHEYNHLLGGSQTRERLQALKNFFFKVGECPKSVDGGKQFFCPSPLATKAGPKWVCVEEFQLCDGVKNCPLAQDENPDHCLFYRAMQAQMGLIMKGLQALNQKSGGIQESLELYEDYNGKKASRHD